MRINKQNDRGAGTQATLLSLALTTLLATPAFAAEDDVLEEVVVTATLRQQSLVEAPVSVTVLDRQTLRDAGRQHFEDVLTAVPNLSYASGTSRPRFFQIRGIGEREEWQGAPNPSVGFLIDGIDFSGMGMPGTLFDVDRIEVLRGPQGLHYGANALGGLIVMRGRDPEDTFGFSTEASIGEYNSQSLGAVATGPVESLNSSWRVAVQNFRSDGFREDGYLGRDDTMDRDELTSRAKWRWRPSESTTVDLTWLHADLNNGYDAWSIDNTRTSLADRPGKDAQRSDGAALRVDTSAGRLGRLTVTATLSESETDYSFDSDWGNAESWAPYTYDYFDNQQRERRGRSLEARITSEEAASSRGLTWVAGVYGLDVDERLDSTSEGVYVDPFFPEYSGTTDKRVLSDYDAQNVAVYAQVEAPFSERWGWSLGLRGEQRNADYSDSRDDAGELSGIDESARDTMWGGQATIHFDPREHLRWFATVSRGYKSGGFNIGEAAEAQAEFLPEYLIGLDVGMKAQWLDGRLYTDVTAFYMKRTDMQVAISRQLVLGDPSSYLLFTDNASGGRNMGIESSLRWRASDQLEIGGTLGLLRTRYSGFRPDDQSPPSDREQAYAPEYQASVNATWRHALGWMARLDVVASDDYYFDVPDSDPAKNNYRSTTYSLTHLKAGYETDRWAVYAWGRNVFDEDYYTRGFFFGNEPPDFTAKRYTQLGEPRQFGVTFRWEFK